MKKINLIQNTSEWHKWRSEGVGASDVPTILGLNPYKTRKQFLNEWMGLAHPSTVATNRDILRGLRLESVAREMLSVELSLPFQPQCGEWLEDNFLRASLDGYVEDSEIICEIKAPRNFRSTPSDTHLFQVQAQLLVSQAKECVYCQVLEGEKGVEIRWKLIKPDALKQKSVIDAITKFKSEIQFEACDVDDSVLWEDYLKAKSSLEAAEQSYRIAETQLKASLGTERQKSYVDTLGRKFSLTRSLRKGPVDYKQIPLLEGVDLEPYRKENIEVVSIKEVA